jgi:uncharacterized membrane protein YGL010W
MNEYFKRQLGHYVEYHRNPTNCTMHVFGIIFLFLAAILPLSWSSVTAFGLPINMATILALPVLIYWLLLDTPLGIGIVCAAFFLLSIAAIIVDHVSPVGVWSISAVLFAVGITLQVVGHRVFERRQPALLDNPAHLLLGPMFVMAKLYIASGLRHDLATIIELGPQQPPCSYTEEHQRDVLPHQ